MKYKKIPVEIEAARYMIDEYLPDWFMDRVTDNTIIIHEDGTCDIKTLEGTMKANKGDYIIKGIKGEIYPCKPDIFKSTYIKSNTSLSSEEFINRCKSIVVDYTDKDITEDNVFVVWYCKTLQNHKAILANNIIEDQTIYEITYNGDKSELYVDKYKKEFNKAITLE